MKEDSSLCIPAGVESIDRLKGREYGAVPATCRAGKTVFAYAAGGKGKYRETGSIPTGLAYRALERLTDHFLFWHGGDEAM